MYSVSGVLFFSNNFLEMLIFFRFVIFGLVFFAVVLCMDLILIFIFFLSRNFVTCHFTNIFFSIKRFQFFYGIMSFNCVVLRAKTLVPQNQVLYDLREQVS